MIDFIRGERRSTYIDEATIVSKDCIFAPQSNNGLGLQHVSTFCSSIKMSWLHRHESFWKTLHLEDLGDKSLLFSQ